MQRATAAYYGMIETIDEYYGIVLDALEAAGQNLDEWIIIYTSDHGEMLGEHGIWEKQKFFEASVGVPLFIRWPAGFGSEGRTVTENVNLCDLFATLCDFTGVPTPGRFGQSQSGTALSGGFLKLEWGIGVAVWWAKLDDQAGQPQVSVLRT